MYSRPKLFSSAAKMDNYLRDLSVSTIHNIGLDSKLKAWSLILLKFKGWKLDGLTCHHPRLSAQGLNMDNSILQKFEWKT